MDVIWLLHNNCALSLDDINSCVSEFMNRYECKPDTLSIHHTQLKNLHATCNYGIKNTSSSHLRFSDKIEVLTYIGYLDVELRFKNEEKYIANSGQEFIAVKIKDI